MFDQLLETALAIKPIVDFVAGLGLAAALLSTHNRHPKELSDEDWRAECETMLYDAQFTPIDITQIMDLAIIVAKATTLDLLDTRER